MLADVQSDIERQVQEARARGFAEVHDMAVETRKAERESAKPNLGARNTYAGAALRYAKRARQAG